MTTTIYRECVGCGIRFGQPNDPGRKRQYHDDACKQRAYRARSGRNGHEGRAESESARIRREHAEAWAKEEARREQERQRSARRRGTYQPPKGMPKWCYAKHGDTAEAAKRRRTCRLLMERALHAGTPEHEATACREKAERLGMLHSLS